MDGETPSIILVSYPSKNGEILYDPDCNHWSLYANYHNYIGGIDNIESIGLLGGAGDYSIKRRRFEVRDYFESGAGIF